MAKKKANAKTAKAQRVAKAKANPKTARKKAANAAKAKADVKKAAAKRKKDQAAAKKKGEQGGQSGFFGGMPGALGSLLAAAGQGLAALAGLAAQAAQALLQAALAAAKALFDVLGSALSALFDAIGSMFSKGSSPFHDASGNPLPCAERCAKVMPGDLDSKERKDRDELFQKVLMNTFLGGQKIKASPTPALTNEDAQELCAEFPTCKGKGKCTQACIRQETDKTMGKLHDAIHLRSPAFHAFICMWLSVAAKCEAGECAKEGATPPAPK